MSREQKNKIARTLCVRYGSCHECPSFPTCVVETFADRICDADYRKQSELTPCDCCKFNPPSSKDGKPCSVCPAQAKMKGGAE